MTDRKLVGTLLVLAAAVLGWTLAVELEVGWLAIAGLGAGVLLALGLVWFWPDRRDSAGPPP